MLYINELRRFEKWFKKREGFSTDYKYKSYILNNKLDKEVSKISYHTHLNNIYSAFDIAPYYQFTQDSLNIIYNSIADKFGFCSILESLRLNNARYHRIERLKNRVGSLISYNTSFFLTLTFTNHYLESTDSFTRRRYVSRFLKSISNDYVANIDFGKKKGREHYHAIVNCDYINSKLWKYGNLDFELINNTDSLSSEKLSKYISKLTNHAIKETCKRNHIIYPKTKK